MKVYEYRLKLKLKQDLRYQDAIEKINYFIDRTLGESNEFMKYHLDSTYKGYVHDSLYPTEADGIYKREKVYITRIRMVDENLLKYLTGKLAFYETVEMKGVGGDISIIAKKNIHQIYCVTPVVLKAPGQGYWRNYMTLPEFEKRLKENLIKKYKYFTGKDIDDDFPLYDLIEFKNKVPVKLPYKGIHLLGDKICLEIAQNETAQELAYLALGVGLLENNTRGCGFVNYQYL